MEIQEIKINQLQKLEEVCLSKQVDFSSMVELLESAKMKKLYKRNNYHQQKIADEIEKATNEN